MAIPYVHLQYFESYQLKFLTIFYIMIFYFTAELINAIILFFYGRRPNVMSIIKTMFIFCL